MLLSVSSQMRRPFTTVVFCVYLVGKTVYGDDAKHERVEAVLATMSGLGEITQRSVSFKNDKKIIAFKAAHGGVDVELNKNGELVSVVRYSNKTSDKVLLWDKKTAAKNATALVKPLADIEQADDPLLVVQENVTGLRNVWSVGWARRIDGYIVKDDFVNITFDETEGLFNFARSWSTPRPSVMPKKTLLKEDALKKAGSAVEEVMKKFAGRFSGYRVDKNVMAMLMIARPNYPLNAELKTEMDLFKANSNNPRLVWFLTFTLAIDTSSSQKEIVDTAGLSVWLDAETGSCVGAEF